MDVDNTRVAYLRLAHYTRVRDTGGWVAFEIARQLVDLAAIDALAAGGWLHAPGERCWCYLPVGRGWMLHPGGPPRGLAA